MVNDLIKTSFYLCLRSIFLDADQKLSLLQIKTFENRIKKLKSLFVPTALAGSCSDEKGYKSEKRYTLTFFAFVTVLLKHFGAF